MYQAHQLLAAVDARFEVVLGSILTYVREHLKLFDKNCLEWGVRQLMVDEDSYPMLPN